MTARAKSRRGTRAAKREAQPVLAGGAENNLNNKGKINHGVTPLKKRLAVLSQKRESDERAEPKKKGFESMDKEKIRKSTSREGRVERAYPEGHLPS